jgi:DNA-binding HxlR family transcriptional regulator
MTRRGTPEADAQRAIVQALRTVLPKGSIVHHSANEVAGGDRRSRLRQAMLVGMGVHPGFADLIVLSGGRVLFLELKSRTGRLRPDQRAFRDAVQAQGFGWALVRSSTTRWARWPITGSPRGWRSPSHPAQRGGRAMSHEATNWAIRQRGLKPTTKIVLWHLCDRFNPDYGCFPSQERLAHDCEISRSTLNEHLGHLEAAGLLRRVPRIHPVTKRQMPTRYILGFEPASRQMIQTRVRNPDTGLRPSTNVPG